MSSVPKPLPWQEGRRATRYKYHWPSGFARRSSHKGGLQRPQRKKCRPALCRPGMPTPVPTGCPVRFYPDPKGVPTAKSLLMQLDCHLIEKPGNGHSIRQSAFWIESFIGFSFGKKLILVILFYHIKRNCGIITERQMRYSAAPNPFSAFAQGRAKRLWAL